MFGFESVAQEAIFLLPQQLKMPAIVIEPEPWEKGVRFTPMSTTEVIATMRKSSALSVITQSDVGRRSRLDVPRPPKADREISQEMLCTYCRTSIGPETFAKRSRWMWVHRAIFETISLPRVDIM